MATAFSTIRQDVGRKLGWMELGTLTAATTTTATDNTRYDPDDFWNEGWLRIYSPVADAQNRRISDWARTTNLFTIYGTFGTTLDGNELYEAWRYVSPTDADQAIYRAIRNVRPFLFQNLSNASLTITGGTYTVTVPAAFLNWGVHRVEVLDPGTGTPIFSVTEFRYRGDGTTLELPAYVVDSYAGYTLRLSGIGELTEPTTDAGTVESDYPELHMLVLGAAAELMEIRLFREPIQNQEKLNPLLGILRRDYEQAVKRYGKRADYGGPPAHTAWV